MHVWSSLKRSFDCKKLEPASDVHGPSSTSTRKPGKDSCPGCFSDLGEATKPLGCSTSSSGSIEVLYPGIHEVVLDATWEVEVRRYCASCKANEKRHRLAANFLSKLRKGNTDSRDRTGPHDTPRSSTPRKSHCGSHVFDDGVSYDISSKSKISDETDYGGGPSLICKICSAQFRKLDAVEEHRLSKHAVIELGERDPTRKIVEIICQKGWLKSDNKSRRVERVLKVHNMQETVAGFEEYRETVKIKASKLLQKQPRCVVDGNELLRFYGTTLVCSLGLDGSASPCSFENCGVCQVLRHGFINLKEYIFTASTSGSALESVELSEEDQSLRKALILCRVIAGRIHVPQDKSQEMPSPGFDSLGRKMDSHSNFEELYVLNPRAVLPCFVVIHEPQ